MQLKLKNHKANIFEQLPFDNSKQSIVFLPGQEWITEYCRCLILKNCTIVSIFWVLIAGHGFTSGPIVNSIDEHSLFCIDVFDQLDIKEPILIGHSWGGLVALDLSTKVKHKMTICMNIAYPFLVGDMLLDFAKGNLDQAVEFLMKYGIHKFPKTEIKTKGFGTMGSGFYGRKKRPNQITIWNKSC